MRDSRKDRISKGLEVFYNSLNYEMFPIKKKINTTIFLYPATNNQE